MASSSVRTKLPLDRFTRLIGYSPILFNQVFIPELQPASSCSDPILQYTWQPRSGGRPGRDEIAGAIQQAEDMMERWLKFPLAPSWVADDRIPLQRAALLGSRWSPGYVVGVRASNFYIIQAGAEAWSAVTLGAVVVYSDPDGDGYKELATVTVATTVTDPDELEVFYPGTVHDLAWEIRPITASITGGVATITFERHQAVMPDFLTVLNADGVDGTQDANFLATVDVYRHYNDRSQMAVVEWDNSPCAEGGIDEVEAATGAITQIDGRNGLVAIRSGTYDTATDTWNYACQACWGQPFSARLWYRAGMRGQDPTRPMHSMVYDLERAVALLALSLMDRQWMACEQVHNLQAHWRLDLAQSVSSPAQSTRYQIARGQLENPFGTTRAAVYAWGVVQKYLVGEAVLGS